MDPGTGTAAGTGATAPAGPGGAAPAKSSVLRSGALMAAGSIVSRATGFIRSAVVVAALGTGLRRGGGGGRGARRRRHQKNKKVIENKNPTHT
ncbi:hypothetical protein ACFVZQ_21790, partial [Streptomyces sp. NPDC059538]